MTVGSLFSGIGGIELGLERAGMTVVWQVEKDDFCRKVLAKHWPDVTRYEDVHDVGEANLTPVDLICGGFPCQDLSVAGKREGLAGERSGLWHEFRRVVGEIAPRWVLIENVPGLLSSNGGADMAVVLGGLEELGYGWTYRVLDSQYFGVAQRRRRVFIVGCSGGRPRPEILFEPESLPWHSAPSREAGTDVTGSLTGSPHSSSCGNPDDNRAQAGFVVAHTLSGRGFDASEDGTGRGTPLVAYRPRDYTDGSFVEDDRASALTHGTDQSRNGIVAQGISENQRAELRLTDISRQLTTGGGKPGQGYPATLDGRAVPRRLTPRECERLQGFPDDWTRYDDEGNEIADSPRYRMLGNAVTVNVAEWIGRRLTEAL